MSGIYDGATGSATLTYNGVPCGARGGPQTSNASSIVPWIATQAGAKADEDMRFAAFDGNDRLSKVLHNKTENIPLSSFGPNDNAYVWKGGVSVSSDTTLNSLSIANDNYAKQLGEGADACAHVRRTHPRGRQLAGRHAGSRHDLDGVRA